MDFFDFIINLLKAHQVAFLFPATIVEGPIVTIIAASLAAAGMLNLGLVFLVALAGDFAGDLLYYGLGRFGRERIVERYGKYIGIAHGHLEAAEVYLKKNAFQAVLVAKISHILGLAILFCIGLLRMNFLRFMAASLVIGIPKTALFVGIGYFLGESYSAISQYLQIGSSMIMFFVSFFLAYKLLRFFGGRYTNENREGMKEKKTLYYYNEKEP